MIIYLNEIEYNAVVESRKFNFKVIRDKHYIQIISNKNIKSIPVVINSKYVKSNDERSDDEILNTVVSNFDFDKFNNEFNIFKKSFNSIEKDIFKQLSDIYDDWIDEEDESFNKNKKYLHFDYIEYIQFGEKPSTFDIWYNNTSHNGDRNKIFGGHSIEVKISIVNSKAKILHGPSLQG